MMVKLLVYGLAVAGAVCELLGILLVSGRTEEVREIMRRYRAAYEVKERRVGGLFPSKQLTIPGMPRHIRVHGSATAVGVAATAKWSVRFGGPLDERLDRLHEIVEHQQERLDELAGSMPEIARDEARAPVRGLVYLATGLALSVAATTAALWL